MPEIFPSLLQFEKKKKKHGGVPGPLFSHTSSGPFFVGKKLGGCLPIKKSSPGGNSSSSPSLYTWQYLWPRDFFVGDLDLDASFDDDTFSPGSEKGEIQFVGWNPEFLSTPSISVYIYIFIQMAFKSCGNSSVSSTSQILAGHLPSCSQWDPWVNPSVPNEKGQQKCW